MENKKPGNCCWCGKKINIGEGILFHVDIEDEMLGIGPMGASGWMVKCPDKEDCQARRKIEEEKRKAEIAEKRRVDNLEDELFSQGEYTSEEKTQIVLDGIVYERLGKGHNIYGGGVQYVVTDDHIWHVQNNGMDGDDWSRNNIRTGGAGAIGRRFNKTTARMNFLRNHAENITIKREKEEQEKRQAKEKEGQRILEGLQKMLKRTSWEELERAMKKRKVDVFCPQELTNKKGRPTVHLTLSEAKNLMIKSREVI